MCSSIVYTRLTNHVMVNEGCQFRNVLEELASIHEFKLGKSGIQSHHSLRIVERYDKPLRDEYRKHKLDYLKMQRQVILALANRGIDDTLGPEGIVP